MRSRSYATAATAAGSAACRHQLLAAPVRCPSSSKHDHFRLQTFSVGADAEGNPEVEALEQQQQQQEGAHSENYTKTRVRRLSRTWEDSSTPNTGIVSITQKSSVPGAAACVAADFKTNRLTRIVPITEACTQRAINTLTLANRMVNQNLQQQAEEEGRPFHKQAVVFQPVEVVEDLAAPPTMPLGANVLYTALLRADNRVLQEALAQRAAVMDAAEAAAASQAAPSGAADATSSSSSRSRAVFEISHSLDYVRVAGGLEGKLSAQGWAEVTCRGREDYALPVLIQALVKLRRLRYGLHKDDITVVLLGDEDILGHNARSPAPSQPGYKPSLSFLVVRCAKNYATKLLPLPQQS